MYSGYAKLYDSTSLYFLLLQEPVELHYRRTIRSIQVCISLVKLFWFQVELCNRLQSREVNMNNLLGGQFLIFLPKNPGKRLTGWAAFMFWSP